MTKQDITSIGLFYKNVDFTWRVSGWWCHL